MKGPGERGGRGRRDLVSVEVSGAYFKRKMNLESCS